MRLLPTTVGLAAAAFAAFAVVAAASLQSAAPSSSNPTDDKKFATTVTISGCLMRNGYATFMVADARLDAIGDKAVAAAATETAGAKSPGPAKWILDDAGNVGVHVGEKVQVIGRTEWTVEQILAPTAQGPVVGPPAPQPHVTVQSLKMLAPSCS